MRRQNTNKIALFIPSLRGGGAERIMLNLAYGFSKSGFDVDLVLAKAEGPYLEDVPNKVNLVDLAANRVLTCLPGLVHYLRTEHPQALLSAMDHTNIIAIWAGLLSMSSTRIVVSVHGTISRAPKRASIWMRPFIRIFLKVFYPMAHKVVVVSEAAKQDFLDTTGLSQKYVQVILNPTITPLIYAKAKKPISHNWFNTGEPPVILGVGRLKWIKDFSTLIKAFALVRKNCEARLLILGEGEERPKLEALVKELKIENDVEMPGFEANPYTYMAHSAVFVLSSLTEGLPTVLIESLALGTPVVSTDCESGPREILKDGKYGYLTPVSDANALAECILKVIHQDKHVAINSSVFKAYTLETSMHNYLKVLLH